MKKEITTNYKNNEEYNYTFVLKKFLETCEKSEYPKEAIKEFLDIINYSKKVLKNSYRIAGYESIVHNIRIGTWIAKSKLGIRTLKCGLLYETCRHVSCEQIRKKFGIEISQMMKDTKKISEYTKKKKKEFHENMSDMLISSLKDVRVIIVKMVAKLENLIAIDVLPREKQLRVAKDVIEFYAPLALRLGVEKIRREFEDKALKVINPKKYNEIVEFLKDTKEERELFLNKLVDEIKLKLKKEKIKIILIRSRVKHIFSIYNKFKRESNLIQQGKKSLKEQNDHYGIRIICKKEEDCFKIKDLLKKHYKIFEIKDYITNKKPNGYQSLHLIIKLENKKVEFQIRTKDMDYLAKYGSASHNAYKGSKPINEIDAKINWLREMFEIQNDSRISPTLKKISFEVFNKSIFCFTPKHDLIKLPDKSTVLDFAYQIHEDIGNKCIGAIVNDKYQYIDFKLKTGDVVEILTHKKQSPNIKWTNFCENNKCQLEIKKELERNNIKLKEKKCKKLIERETKLVQIENNDKNKIILSHCCNPIPDERIIGIKIKNKIYIHKKNCEKIISKKNKIHCSWTTKEINNLNIIINAEDRVGIISDLLKSIKNNNNLISNIIGEVVNKNNAQCIFVMKKINLGKVSLLIKKLSKVKGVTSIKVRD